VTENQQQALKLEKEPETKYNLICTLFLALSTISFFADKKFVKKV